jgi:TetR/AcrR family fatty acid metabolism transcriptional regulator
MLARPGSLQRTPGGIEMVEGVAARSLKERQYQEREELIRQAAEEMLFERGYHEMSMDDIAARVGIAKGTLYRHFASKEDLVFALMMRDLSEVVHNLEEIRATNASAQEKLAATFRGIYQKISGKYVSLLDSSMMPSFTRERMACLKEIKDPLLEHIRHLLVAGQASGEFDATLPTDVLVYAVISLISPISYKRLVAQGNMAKEELETDLIRILLKIVAPPN